MDDGLQPLADALALDPRTVLRALGGGWTPCAVGARDWPADRWGHATWFVTGQPPQVLVGVDFAALVLARPVIAWAGHHPVPTAADVREFARDDVVFQPDLLADAVEELARASRRRLRWCRTCRTPHPPEHMLDRLDCQTCGKRYRGVVF